ncbi:hypothetical protein NDU88_003777 [Pleurodeles waltl]|uniref:Uncharacterized protein n=1 Tax=Pleurodeles waltl TaxID=8319 RepID=A0AAV7M4E1_PLEWA|nr:hypothetical protein NDU88_003777 [Pleurodeles waltl]
MEQLMVGRDAIVDRAWETTKILGNRGVEQLKKDVQQDGVAIAELELQLRETQRHQHHLQLCQAKEKENDQYNWHQSHKQPISQELQREMGNHIQLAQEKGQQMEDKDRRLPHKSHICLEHEKSNELDLTLCKKKERRGKGKKVKPPPNTSQLTQELPKGVGPALQLSQETEKRGKGSRQFHEFPICQAFKSDRVFEMQLLREKEKRAKDEKARQGNHVLELQPEHASDRRRELHPRPEKGETDIACQHKPENGLQLKPCRKKGEPVTHQMDHRQRHKRSPPQNPENENRRSLQLGQEKGITDLVQPHKPEKCRESGSQQQLNTPISGKKLLNEEEVFRITEQIRERERKRQLKRQQMEARRITTMNTGVVHAVLSEKGARDVCEKTYDFTWFLVHSGFVTTVYPSVVC